MTCMKILSTNTMHRPPSLHNKNNYTMSDFEDYYDYYKYYGEDEDNDDRIHGHPVEDLEDITDYERGIMLAEKGGRSHCLFWLHWFQAKRV